ncbi:MAG: MFS transporter, partial [Candidatus Thiodiazotropha sp.]
MENTRLSAIQRPQFLLLLMAIAVPLSHAAWMTLLNNFAIERAAFSGREIGILQSLREIPGFLAFGVVFLLLLIREQRLAYLALALLGLGTAVTGLFPSVAGLYITTVIMSIGFHYYETLQTSLALQWIDKARTPETLGRLIAAGSFASILTFALIWLFDDQLQLDYPLIYLIMGGLTLLIVLIAWLGFPLFPQKTEQHKHMVFRKRYWLYYTLTFMSGARRQIFIVFAGFLMVEKFGFSVSQIALLFLINAGINVFVAPRIGRLIGRIGERRALLIEYAGLILVFCGYALVETAWIAAVLYIIDHLFFAMAIALKTYFQKIAATEDI